MFTWLRLRFPRLATAGLMLGSAALLTTSCRRILGGGDQASMDDIEANLDDLVAVAKTGLTLEVSPRFQTFGPVPSAAPWDSPVKGGRAISLHGLEVKLRTGRDGLMHERYEARPCPLREIWSCVELWATGKFGKNNQLACVGLRLEKGTTIEKRKLDPRAADNCPFLDTGPGPAQQVVRGLEKAQLEHTERQEPDKYLDPKAR